MELFSFMISERKITHRLPKIRKVWINTRTQYGTFSGSVRAREIKGKVL